MLSVAVLEAAVQPKVLLLLLWVMELMGVVMWQLLLRAGAAIAGRQLALGSCLVLELHVLLKKCFW